MKGSNNREAGWLAVKELLKVNEVYGEGETFPSRSARLHIFSNCVNIIEHLPALQRDQKHPTDCMTEPHNITHLPDALRYFALTYTTPAEAPKTELTAIGRHERRLLRQMKSKKFYY